MPLTKHPANWLAPLRWSIVVLLALSVLISYVDRGNLSLAASPMSAELNLSPSEMGRLLSAFFWTYAASQLFAGWLMDRFDVRRLLGYGFLGWTLATAATAFVSSFGLLFALRMALGLGESVAYPAAAKIISNEFPEHKRGFANAMVDASAKLGPAVGTFLGGLLMARFGWRMLFLALGVGGLAWLPFWFASKGGNEQADRSAERAVPATEILRLRTAWGTFIGLFGLNYTIYFLISWLPYYLVRVRHFSDVRMAIVGSLPFWGMAAASLLSGRLSDAWIARGADAVRVRKTFLVVGLMMSTLLIPVGMVDSVNLAMGLIIVASLSYGAASSNLWAFTQTLAGPRAAGKWTGLENALGNLAGVAAPWLTGVIVERTGSFVMAFVAAALMAVMGAVGFGWIARGVEAQRWESSIVEL